jgi:subfamily B ATP-binding cassette protein MsbA
MGPTDSAVLRFLRQRVGRHFKWLVPSVVFAVGTALVNMQTVNLPKHFIDDALAKKRWDLVLFFAGALVALFLLDGFFDYFHRFSLRVCVERTVRDLRKEIFDRLMVFSHDQASRYTSGKAVNHIVSDVQVMSNGLHIAADVIKEPLVLLALLGTLFYTSWKLTLVCFIAIPLVGLIGKLLGKSARRNQARLQDAMENVSNHVLESLGGLRTAHAFGRTRTLREEFSRYLDESYGFLIRLARAEESVSPTTKFITSIVGGALIAFGGRLVVDGELTAGGLVTFITAAAGMQQPLRQLNQVNVRLQQVIAAARRLVIMLEEPLDDVARSQARILTAAVPPPAPRKREARPLIFENVSYKYPHRTVEDAETNVEDKRPWALEQLSLELPAGRRLALVGKSGSGKSTMTLLALRFLDPTSGRVILGDKPANEWDLGDYRAHFSWVSQDIFLFNRTIRENLSFARSTASDKDIWAALEKAQLKDFVERLPRKLDTQLGERASRLSGGEKQRLAIARAFLKDAPLVVLDEATSNLDATSEEAVSRALYDLMEDRSVLVIAHRLNLIREVDEVAVLGEGKLLEKGPPETLLDLADGHFRKLWDTQRGDKRGETQA